MDCHAGLTLPSWPAVTWPDPARATGANHGVVPDSTTAGSPRSRSHRSQRATNALDSPVRFIDQ